MNSETIHPFFQGFDFFSFVHRGGAEEATENTLEAFKYAADMGFIFMETDIQGTKAVSYTHLTLPTICSV